MQLEKNIKFINMQMVDYIKDMEIRGKYGDLEKKVILLGNGVCFTYLREFY